MEERELITHLKNIHRDPPRAEWISHTRSMLMAHAQCANGIETARTRWFDVFSHMMPVRVAVSMSALAVGIAVLAGTISVQRTIPTNSLYPLKLAMESAKGTLAFTSQQRALHELDIAQTRIEELRTLSKHAAPAARVATGVRGPNVAISGTAKRYAEALKFSAAAVREMQAQGNTVLAKETAEKLNETAHAYTVLLASMETATGTLPVLPEVAQASKEAEEAASDLLSSFAQIHEEAAASATGTEPSTSTSTSEVEGVQDVILPEGEVLPSVTPSAAIPSILPNVVGEE